MNFEIHRPPAELAPYVECIWTLRGDSGDPQTIFPDGRSEIVIQRGDPFVCGDRVQPRAIFVGQMRGPVTIAPTGRVDSIGIRFRPAGAHAFFRFSQSETAGRICALDDVASGFARSLDPRPDGQGCLDALLLRIKREGHAALDFAIREIAASRGSIKMERLAASANMTLRQLQRLFSERVGLDPKTFARIVRFQHVLSAPEETWAAAAAGAGYFDQAHLIRDFRQFTGETPAAWAQRRVAFLQDRDAERQ